MPLPIYFFIIIFSDVILYFLRIVNVIRLGTASYGILYMADVERKVAFKKALIRYDQIRWRTLAPS
jgi:hypothetical protein